MVNLPASTAAAVEAVASHPKVAMAVSAGTTALGTASVLAEIQTVLGVVSVLIGIAIGLLVWRINAIKLKIYQRAWQNGELPKE